MYYFDNSATTKPLKDNLDTVNKVAQDYYGNPSSLHRLGEEARKLLEHARKQVAGILDYKASEIIFTSSGTEGNNWVIRDLLPALKVIHPDKDEVIVSAGEHASMYRQFPLIEALGFKLKIAKLTPNGSVDLDYLKEILSPNTLLLSTVSVNSEVGALQPINSIADLLTDYPQVIWHCDSVQAITCEVDLIKHPRIDLLTLSGHKFHSLRGVGILAKRERVEDAVMLYGGGQEFGLRSGTEPLALIVATARALRQAAENQTEAKKMLTNFRKQIIDQLETLGWKVFAKDHASGHIVCGAYEGIPGEVMVHALEAQDVYVSTTTACSSRRSRQHATLIAMGVSNQIAESAIRISLAQTTTQEEVTYLLQALQTVTKSFEDRERV